MRTFASKLHQFLDRQQPTRASAGLIYNWYRVHAAITYLTLKWPVLISLDIPKLIFFAYAIKETSLNKTIFFKILTLRVCHKYRHVFRIITLSMILLSRLTVTKFVNKKINLA